MKKRFLKRGRGLLAATVVAALVSSGCGDSENFVFTNGVGLAPSPVLNAPIANNDAFNALGNATLNRTAANGVLANDTLNEGEIIEFDSIGTNGGALVLNADGSLNYTPVFGFVGAESFDYTLANVAGESTATVTFTSTGRGFFVDNTASPDGNGSQAQPFDTLAEATSAAANGDTVFVSRGDGTSTGLDGQVDLPPGVNLIGEGAGLVVAQTIVPPGQAPLLQGPIVAGGNNVISGLTIQGSATYGVQIENVGNVTISGNTFDGHDDEHVFMVNISGTVTISGNTFENPSDDEDDILDCTNTDSNADLVIVDNVFRNTDGNDVDELADIEPGGNSVMNITFSRNTANQGQFNYGLYIECAGSSQVTATVEDNVMSNFEDEVIGVHSREDTASISGSISRNTISNVDDDDAVHAVINGGTMTISGNIISDVFSNCIDMEVEDNGGIFIVENNQLSGSEDEHAIELEDGSDEETKIAIRNNTTSDTDGSDIRVVWSGEARLCLDISGNTVEDRIQLINDGAFGDFDVEQFNTLSAVNNGADIDDQGTINNVADGACMIP